MLSINLNARIRKRSFWSRMRGTLIASILTPLVGAKSFRPRSETSFVDPQDCDGVKSQT